MKTTNSQPRSLARLAMKGLLLCFAFICCSWAGFIQTAQAATFTVTNTNDSGAGSLRAAILAANATAGPSVDTINFNIPGSGVHTIAPLAPLPAITTPTVIDGYTQPGAQANTNADGAINAVPLVELNGAGTTAGAGAENSGLVINGSGVTVRGLVINRFKHRGISVISGVGVTVAGNFIGTDPSGASDLGNAFDGVLLVAGDSINVGGAAAADRNLLSGNGGEGIFVSGGVTKLVITGNLVGTDKGGAANLGNDNNGISLTANGAVVSKNVISGNAVNGVTTSKFSDGNTITSNLIGLNAAGTAALPNAEDGVNLRGNNHAVDFNTISGNGKSGIRVRKESVNDQSPEGNKIRANRIGTDVGAGVDLGNKGDGVTIEGASHTTIGGSNVLGGNLISGNDGAGVRETGASSDTVISGNLIGTNGAGDAALGNTLDGVLLESSFNTVVGGSKAADANTISGNKRHGVNITSDGNFVRGNFIGTKADGASPMPNTSVGVLVELADDNEITGNRIAFNGSHGVQVGENSVRDKISDNSIHSNAGLGINLGADGVSANDAGDADTGPNNLQNYPVITSAKIESGKTQIAGKLNSVAAASPYTVHLYANSACDSSGHGEGQQLIGTAFVTANGSDVAFNINTSAVAPGTFITATATSPTLNTSEFSQCAQVAGDTPTVSVGDLSVVEGNSGLTDAVFSVTLSATSSQAVSVSYETGNNLAQNPAFAGEDFDTASGTLNFAPGETSKQVTVKVKGDATQEPDEIFILLLTNPNGATIAKNQGECIIKNDDASAQTSFQFEKDVYTTQEDSTKLAVAVTRTGDLSAAASVDYETKDGNATERGEYTTALGTLRFEAGEAKKTFELLITEDSYDELAEESLLVQLLNPSAGATIGAQSATTIKVMDDGSEQPGNTNDDAEMFVRQHYHDFLNREADSDGLQFWTSELLSCGADTSCLGKKREQVSSAFFLSIEFQETGFLVHRLSEASFDKLPRYRDFVRDSREIGAGVVVGQAGWEQKLEANKQAFLQAWVARAEFKSKYDPMTNEQYVDALYANAGVVPQSAERQGHVDGLNNQTETRAGVLRKVCESGPVMLSETNRAFVLMQYFGYLRRNPDDAPDLNMDGYDFWLAKLNQFGGNFQKAEMVKAFLVSIEYRSRFGQP